MKTLSVQVELVEGESVEDGEAITRGLLDPQIRAFVKICGVLVTLPSDRARARVLDFVADKCAEEAHIARGK